MTLRRELPGSLVEDEVVQDCRYLELDPVPRSTSTARRFVASVVPPLPEEVLDAALLLTSELVTNATIHARTAIEVGVLVTGRAVVVAVHDLDLASPLQQPYPGREGGWGLALVASLSQTWSTTRHREGGKTTWFRLDRTGAPVVDDGAAARPESDTEPAPERDPRMR